MWGTLDDGERRARKVILNLIAGGKIPSPEMLAGALACSAAVARRLLDGLAAKGFVVRDAETGGITAAYPLSIAPTRHRVILETGQAVHALCAVDALGVSPLFGVSAAIEARCPHCEQTVLLHVEAGDIVKREPTGAVLWYSMADLLEKRVEGLNLSAEH